MTAGTYVRRRDGRVRFRVIAIRGDNILGEATWTHKGHAHSNVTLLTRDYFVRRYGRQPEAA